jgi:hypothetical protein
MESDLEREDRPASWTCVKAVDTTNYAVVKELQSIPLILTTNIKPLRHFVNRHETLAEVTAVRLN